MKRTLFSSIALVLSGMVIAQVDSVAMKYAATITEQDLKKHLTILASDEYEGRETGYPGQKKAAEYLIKTFGETGIGPVPDAAARGLMNGYELTFPLEVTHVGGLGVSVNDHTYAFAKDYFYFSDRVAQDRSVNEILFAGYGNDYSTMSATDKVVLVLETIGATTTDDFFQGLTAKARAAEAAGASVLLIASEHVPTLIDDLGHFLGGSRMRLAGEQEKGKKKEMQTIVISRVMAEDLMASAGVSWKKAKKLAKKTPRVMPTHLTLTYKDRTERMEASDVLGYVEGSDKKEELVVVTAHYDHIGVHDGEVYNGADDDGSGTVALLELAQAFSKAKAEGHGPRRSMLFMPVSGEEKGLLGSEYYSEHPVFPLANTVADLNIDMIGRVDSAHANSAPYVYIIGSDRLSTELHQINERANETYVGLELDQTFNAHDDPNRFYFRSDHYNFAKHGVPVIFYFSGVHEDYHQPGDEVQKIRFDLLRERTLLVFHTAWILANRQDRIVVDGKIEED